MNTADDYGRATTKFFMILSFEHERHYRRALRAKDHFAAAAAEGHVDNMLREALRSTKQADAAKRIYGDE